MERVVFVFIDLEGKPQLVGRLWSRFNKGRETASFEYEKTWLSHLSAFALEPALTLDAGTHHTPQGRAIFGAFGDSAPDRWGRVLMKRAERLAAAQDKRPVKTLAEADYLLMVNDETRQGALRFADNAEGPFLTTSGKKPIPPLLELPKLLAASQDVLDETESEADLRLLLAPGSSLGGARPKASVRDKDGSLAIAKFPQKDDTFQTELWEILALNLAEKSGIPVPERRIAIVNDRPVLILRRFDRAAQNYRIPFLSAMSMLGAQDNETHSYLEIADALRRFGATPQNDLVQLWRRIVFNVLISNTDDHLRNHGFLHHHVAGWTLSPAYDLNPVPAEIKPRILSTSIGTDDPSASLRIAKEHAGYFGLDNKQAQEIISEVLKAVRGWRDEAQRLLIPKREIERMASAFEHEDSVLASI
jgi:serine/threonine-protein kinase HipA